MMKLAALATVLLATLARADDAQLLPPQPIDTPAAVYPPAETRDATVVVNVLIAGDGSVTQAELVSSAGAPFDEAAVAAVKLWKFRPALRNAVAVPARVRIPFRFVAPTPVARPSPPSDATPEPAGTAPAPSGQAPSPLVVPVTPVEPVSPRPQNAEQPAINEVSVRGHQKQVERGAAQFQIEVGQLAIVPTKNAAAMMQWAPGIALANEGGEGHAEQVFLRGFNAEQGQDIEFTVNGVPINEVGNTDGHGYADTHFIIPEVVKSLEVTEGPFDPHQGDFAVAGSARYELGVKERRLHFESWLGSYGTQRQLALWAPKGQRDGTFAAAQFQSSDGNGTNRASSSASAMAQYEGPLGERGLWRVLATTYGTHYKSAGVVRADDVKDNRVDFYGTEDPSQGGDAQRHSLSVDIEVPTGGGVLTQQLFGIARTLRITENFTGFLLDDQAQGQSLHFQRGDGLEKDYAAATLGARGAYRLRSTLLGHEQSLEVGYFARYDHATPELQRLRFGTQIPYRVDLSSADDVINLAGFVDADLKLTSWLSLRGGVRQEYFHYDVVNECATAGQFARGAPLDTACPAFDRSGPRLPTSRATATGSVLEPKVTAIARLPLDVTLSASWGIGAQSLDPYDISQDENAPFAKLEAEELGVMTRRRLGAFDVTARASGYRTHVAHDLVFDPAAGRLAAASGTTREGFAGSVRVQGAFIDELASVTTANATFDDDHNLVPYVPLTVARNDTALFGTLPGATFWGEPVGWTLGLGLGYVGRRPLPFGQFSDSTFVVDGSASVRVQRYRLGLRAMNLLDAKFPLSEFFYASDFHSRAYATLAPALHFTAAPPRIMLLTFSVDLDREADE